MVMHARKYPRHNDGYYDRTQAHPFEEKYPSKSQSGGGGGSSGSYNDRFSDRSTSKESPSTGFRVREDSPGRPSPRYHNKSSYKDRVKDRASKGSNNSPGDSRLNHHFNPNSRPDTDRHTPSSSSSTTSKPYKSLESLKSEPKDPKTEQIQKNALRVSGDWSEHRSSSGKKYYYNCKSEISQWEKPKDWIELSANLGRPTDNSRSKDRNGREARNTFPTATSTKSSDERYRHSSGGGVGVPSSSSATSNTRSTYPSSSCASAAHSRSGSTSVFTTTASSSSSSPAAATYDHRHSHTPHKDGAGGESHRDRGELRKHWSVPVVADQRYPDHSHSSGGGGGSSSRESGLQRIPVLCRSHSEAGNYSGSSGTGHHRHGNRASRDHRGDDYHPHHQHKGSAAFNGARNSGDMSRNENEDSRQTEDMDISPGSTPTSSRPSSHVGTPSSSLNNAHMTASGLTSSNVNMGNNLTQAIQTLQKLQQALMAQQQHQLQQQQQTNTSVSQSPRHPADATPPHSQAHASPHFNNSRGMVSSHPLSTVDEDSRDGRESPKSDRSIRNSRGSPTLSMASSPSVTLSGSSLGAANKKQDSVQLTPSLSNYYKDSLVEHCSNIQADQAERQANRYGEEAHSVGTLHCTQVSVELKRARSEVRIAEIQATLHEQRVLFLRQETRDLENMRSQNSFMPSQQGT